MLLERDIVRIDKIQLEKYLNLYANSDSIKLSENQLEAINKLFEIGYINGFYKNKIDIRKFMIPNEYKDYRFA